MTEPHSEQVQGARRATAQATAPAEGQERAASGQPAAPDNLRVNAEKRETIEVDGVAYRRFAIQTHTLTIVDDLVEVVERYVKPHVRPGDIVFMSEKAVGCTQGRAVKLTEIHPRPLAVFLSKHVTKTPAGIGLGMPETMEMALQEVGTPRILFAVAASVVGKLLGRKGWFYKVAGRRAASIDGPCSYTLPPYNQYVSLAPAAPDETAAQVAAALGCTAVIVDQNDLGGEVLGTSDAALDAERVLRILKDNPLGQESQRTPFGIIRKAS